MTEPREEPGGHFQGTTHILAVLDKSGSMGPIRDQTISGFNEWLGDLQQSNPDDPMTIVLFDTVYSVAVSGEPVRRLNPLDETRYTPGGLTALYDAMSRACREAETRVRPEDRALVVIVTDGQENSSRETTKQQAMELVSRLEERGNWTFTYLSAHPSAFADAGAIGIRPANVADFAPTPEGVKKAFDDLRFATDKYAKAKYLYSKEFYRDDDERANPKARGPEAPRR